MAADDNILKSFLYQIGAKIDEPSVRRAGEQLGKLEKFVLGIGAAIEGLALTLAAVTVKMADGFDKLYWSSQRTGSSVRNMKAFEYGVSQLGGTVEGAHSALESFAAFMRRTPAASTFIKTNFGVSDKDAQGNLKDQALYLQQILEVTGRLYQAGGAQRAKGLGLAAAIGVADEDTLRAVINPEFIGFLRQYNEEVARSGVNLDQTAKNSKEFMQQVRGLASVLDLLKDKVYSDLEGKFGKKLMDVTDYLRTHLDEIAKRIEAVIDKLIFLETKLEAGVQVLGGWVTVSEELLGLWAGAKALGAIANVLKFFGLLRGASAVAGTAEGVGLGAGTVAAGGVALAAGGALLTAGGIAWALSRYTGDEYQPGAAKHPGMHYTRLGRGGHWGASQTARQAIDYFVSQGWTREQAAGLVARVARESSFNPAAQGDYTGGRGNHATAYGILQWHKDRQEAFKRWSGHDIKGSSLGEQLAFMQYELTQGAEQAAGRRLRAQTGAYGSGGVASRYFARPKDVVGEEQLTGQGAYDLFKDIYLGQGGGTGGGTHGPITINNNLDVHSNDPHAAGAAVAAVLPRATADQLRNTKGALQ